LKDQQEVAWRARLVLLRLSAGVLALIAIKMIAERFVL